MATKNFLRTKKFFFLIAFSLCVVFSVAYSVLAFVRHEHYQSFGYDLGINNQVVWRYSLFQSPLTTSDPFPDKTKLVTHVELVYALIAPFYWIWSNARTLLIVQVVFLCFSVMAIFLLAQRYKLSHFVSIAMVVAYLLFYGVQNALWADVHSAPFAAGFIAWFLYFLDKKNYKTSWVFLVLAMTAKENIGALTLTISFVYFVMRRERKLLWMMLVSLTYVLFIYLIYFPQIVNMSYLYQNKAGLLSNINPLSLVDSPEKREAIFYSLSSVGFLPVLFPLSLIPIISDFATYFVLASDLKASHGIFMHYRVTLAPLLLWGTILMLAKYKKINQTIIGIYLISCVLVIQYLLHLPLSYLTKSWFWAEPSGVKHIELLRKQLKPTDAVVAQNNILPHIARRDKIYALYPEKKTFVKDSPCGKTTCDWFRWADNPQLLFIDTSIEWDARHYLTERDNFIAGLQNMERKGIIKKKVQSGSAVLYEVLATPE